MGFPYTDDSDSAWVHDQIMLFNQYSNQNSGSRADAFLKKLAPQEESSQSTATTSTGAIPKMEYRGIPNVGTGAIPKLEYRGIPNVGTGTLAEMELNSKDILTASTGAIPKLRLEYRGILPLYSEYRGAPTASTGAIPKKKLKAAHKKSVISNDIDEGASTSSIKPPQLVSEDWKLETNPFLPHALLTKNEPIIDIMNETRSPSRKYDIPISELRAIATAIDEVELCQAAERLSLHDAQIETLSLAELQKAEQELRSLVHKCVSLQPNKEPMISLRETKNLRNQFETLHNIVVFSSKSDVPVVSLPASKNSTEFFQKHITRNSSFEHNLKRASVLYQDMWNQEAVDRYWNPSHLGPPQRTERVRVTIPVKKPKTMKKRLSKIGRTLFDIAFKQ